MPSALLAGRVSGVYRAPAAGCWLAAAAAGLRRSISRSVRLCVQLPSVGLSVGPCWSVHSCVGPSVRPLSRSSARRLVRPFVRPHTGGRPTRLAVSLPALRTRATATGRAVTASACWGPRRVPTASARRAIGTSRRRSSGGAASATRVGGCGPTTVGVPTESAGGVLLAPPRPYDSSLSNSAKLPLL